MDGAALDTDQVKAIKYLVKQSPAGEIDDIIEYLATLAGSHEQLSSSPEIMAALRKWYELHRYHILLPDGRKGLVSSAGFSGTETEDPKDMFVYYDYTHQLAFTFNPLAPSESSIVSDQPMEVPSTPLKDAIVAAMPAYLQKSYGQGNALFSVTIDGDQNMNIEISSHSAKLESFWSGIWLSTWTVSGATLSGNIKAKNHYFEIGNLQLNLNKDFDAIPVKDINNADSIIKAIKDTEDKVSENEKMLTTKCFMLLHV